MIAFVKNNYTTTIAQFSPATRSTAAAFAGIMASTTETDASSGEASVSKAAVQAVGVAKAQAALSAFDTSYSNVDHSQADYDNHFAEGAKLVSASQGLPEGQYDFTRMSDKQLQIVTRDLGRKGKLDLDQSGALTLFMSPMQTAADGSQTLGFSEVPVNRFAQLKAVADYDSQHGYAASAAVRNAALATMTAMHEAAGIPVSYVETSQKTASSITGDSSAKLKEALAAFRKEASLTPAQRARRDVLKTMNLTEDAIKAMPPEQQKATEEKIAAEVARRLRLGEANGGKAILAGADTGSSAPIALGA